MPHDQKVQRRLRYESKIRKERIDIYQKDQKNSFARINLIEDLLSNVGGNRMKKMSITIILFFNLLY
jgi:hypothetical protein